jgi:hypothetical protein
MTLLVIVLITATPFVFWFFRRRTKRRSDEERSENRPTISNPIADEINTAVIGVERSPDRPPLEQTEEELGEDARGEPESKQPAAFEVVSSAQRQQELDASALQKTESHHRDEANGAKLIEDDPARSNEQLANSDHVVPPTSNQTSLEDEKPRADIGIFGISGQYSSEKPIDSPAPIRAGCRRWPANRSAQRDSAQFAAWRPLRKP